MNQKKSRENKIFCGPDSQIVKQKATLYMRAALELGATARMCGNWQSRNGDFCLEIGVWTDDPLLTDTALRITNDDYDNL